MAKKCLLQFYEKFEKNVAIIICIFIFKFLNWQQQQGLYLLLEAID